MCVWRYDSLADACRGLLSSAGGTRAAQDAGREAVCAAIEQAVAPFTDPATGVISMRNVFRWVSAENPGEAPSLTDAQKSSTGRRGLVDFHWMPEQGAA